MDQKNICLDLYDRTENLNMGSLFCTYAKFTFFYLLIFLPPDTHTYLCVSEGKNCRFFGKFSLRTK